MPIRKGNKTKDNIDNASLHKSPVVLVPFPTDFTRCTERLNTMAGRTCDICHAAECRGLIVFLVTPERHFLPALDWGRLCWPCVQTLAPVALPHAPMTPATWHTWLEHAQTRLCVRAA